MDITPKGLSDASACYCFSDQQQADAVIIMLLASIAGDTSTPAQLAAKGKCYCYGDKQVAESVKIMLLAEIANAVGA